jgi:hypothetical protein
MTKLLPLLFVFCQGHIYDDDAQLAAPAFHEVRRWRRGHAWENSVGSSLVGDMDALASIKSPAGDQIRGWLGMRGGTRPAPDKRASTQAPRCRVRASHTEGTPHASRLPSRRAISLARVNLARQYSSVAYSKLEAISVLLTFHVPHFLTYKYIHTVRT